ncbi:NAD-dependent epimerase/dehydratase family protein [Pseudobacteriovorax antillogorgiicola]|uniref:UDP-glucose 4-epimerase n=1 Tax=Pseudobacteriovorax antillogorgiicola TaxID=1513793 RepID=A0A1Y6CM02_9BACT|nr:SDR family oxidoreductase [Pseudobacteriovorax antillogorgiicola]TCS45223.1 UDP-glucose 4-epimerase [Pseudobacteriovorax antillogorgiicola]SMF75400.1 UDP-glucose 4-epimerase [Pseudobacteriovorax antillogorgiicola]
MNVLLTGSSGNLGRHLRHCGKNRYISIRRTDLDTNSVAVPSNTSGILHAAFDLKLDPKVDPYQYYESNVGLTCKLLNAALSSNIDFFAYISSSAVYGKASITNESQHCRPINHYGRTKLFCEKIIADFCEKNGIKCEVYRVFNLFGGEDRFSVLSKLNHCIKNQIGFTLANSGKSQRDFIHVEDAATIIDSLLNSHQFDILNIGSGSPTSLIQIVQAYKEINDFEIIHVIRDEIPSSVADISRLKQLIRDPYFRPVISEILTTD